MWESEYRPPEAVHVPSLQTCDDVTIWGKWDFADVINDVRMGRFPRLGLLGPM